MILETDCKPADAPVISEIIEIIIQKEDLEESNDGQTDVSFHAADPQTVSVLFIFVFKVILFIVNKAHKKTKLTENTLRQTCVYPQLKKRPQQI